MHEKNIVCTSCGRSYPLKVIFICKHCGGSLEIIFDYKKLKKLSLQGRPFNHARYSELYPVRKLVSLGEGGTPLLRSRNLEKSLGVKLYFKLESANPTGSFKDRGSSVEVAKALESRKAKTVCASTGNMGASVAAYSAAAGLGCTVIVPRDAKKVKLQQILAYGSRVLIIPGTFNQAASLAEQVHKKKGHFLLGDYLYRREGTKSVGFELAEQVQADHIFVPIGNGILLSGLWKGLKEFHLLKLLKKKPRIAGVQAKGSSTIAAALLKSGSIKALKKPKTVATAIEVGSPLDGVLALKALKESRGFGVEVSDNEILKARDLLARKEGIFAEPAGAAALAGLLKSRPERGSTVVCLVTGHGLKTPFTGVKGNPLQAKNLNILDKIR